MSGGIRQLLRSQSPVQSFNPEETMEQAQSQGSSPPTVPAHLESGESIGQIVRDVNGDLEATLDNAFPKIQVTDEEGNLTDEVQQAVRQVPEGFQFEVVNPDEDAVKQKLSEQDTSAVQSDDAIIRQILSSPKQSQSSNPHDKSSDPAQQTNSETSMQDEPKPQGEIQPERSQETEKKERDDEQITSTVKEKENVSKQKVEQESSFFDSSGSDFINKTIFNAAKEIEEGGAYISDTASDVFNSENAEKIKNKIINFSEEIEEGGRSVPEMLSGTFDSKDAEEIKNTILNAAQEIKEGGEFISNLTMNALDPENENGITAPILEAADDFVAQPLADLVEKTQDMVSGADVSFEGDDSGILGTSISKGEMSDGLAEALRIGLTAVGTAADRQAFQQSFRAVQKSRRAENLDQRIKLKESIIGRIKQAGISGERAAKFADKQFERHFGESAPEEFKTILREGDLEKGTDAVAAQRINTLTYQAMSEMGRAETDEEKKEVVDRYTQLITADPQIPLDKKEDTIDLIRQNSPGSQGGGNADTGFQSAKDTVEQVLSLSSPNPSQVDIAVEQVNNLSDNEQQELASQEGFSSPKDMKNSLRSRRADSQPNFDIGDAEDVREQAMQELDPTVNKIIADNASALGLGDAGEVERENFKKQILPETQKIDSFLSNFSNSAEGLRAGRAVKSVERARIQNNVAAKVEEESGQSALSQLGSLVGLSGQSEDAPRRIPQNVGLYRQGYEIISKSDSILEQTGNLQEQHLSEYLVRLHGDDQINFDKKVTRDLINGEVQRMLLNSSEFSNFNESQIKDATQFILERFPTISSDNPYEKARQILEDARDEITNG